MTALAADKKRHVKAPHLMVEETILLADSQTVYEGALISVNSSGLAVVGSDTASEFCVGVAKEAAVSGSSNTTVKVTVQRGHREWFAKNSNVTAADIGAQGVIEDDGTVSDAGTETNDVKVGKIVAIETVEGTAGCWVEVCVASL